MALTPEQQAAVAALVAQQARAYERIDQRLVDSVLALFQRLGGFDWFDDRKVRPVTRQVVQLVRTAQVAAADVTEQYLDEVFDVMEIDTPPRAYRRRVKVPVQLRAVSPEKEWERPARDARVGILVGLDEFEAKEKALKRAAEQARMDVALAVQHAEQQKWGVSEEIIGYRRILHPELSKGGVCALCIVAADRTYSKGDLKPLHGGCHCTVLPVTKASDPGLQLNKDDLDRYYEAAGGTGRQGLQRVRVKVLEHGELGPILVDNKYKNRDAKQTKSLADQGLDPQRVFDAQDALVKKFEADVAAGKDVPLKTLAFHRRMRDEWAKKLATKHDRAA